jgi:hypothetical protein
MHATVIHRRDQRRTIQPMRRKLVQLNHQKSRGQPLPAAARLPAATKTLCKR